LISIDPREPVLRTMAA